jgi:Na+/proline symporter
VAERVPTRLTGRPWSAAEGRRFGLTLGAAFALLGGLLWWRGHAVGALASIVVATVVAAAGLIIPARLEPVERAWMKLAHALSWVTTPLFMGVVYFLVITPIGIVRRSLGRSALHRSRAAPSYWVARDITARRSDLERQF